jgi:hypothetical protein
MAGASTLILERKDLPSEAPAFCEESPAPEGFVDSSPLPDFNHADFPEGENRSPRSGLKRSTKVLVGAAVLISLAVVLAVWHLAVQRIQERDAAVKGIMEAQRLNELSELNMKADQLEQAFRENYQMARTIGLLPGIRSIKGRNAPANFKPGWNEALFPRESVNTVQQLFNNLAVNIPISEIYCIRKEFHPAPSGEKEDGETPFYMWDTINFSLVDHPEPEEGEEKHDPTAPDEFEGSEYAWIAQELRSLEGSYPRFAFKNADDIPCLVSPRMRTCDNAQYLNKMTGDVREADGFIIGVPFYETGGNLGG